MVTLVWQRCSRMRCMKELLTGTIFVLRPRQID